ncbi:unnamed protein product, partial [Strongylus vulgaris]
MWNSKMGNYVENFLNKGQGYELWVSLFVSVVKLSLQLTGHSLGGVMASIA